MDRIVLSLLVDNTSGVLSRVAGLFCRAFEKAVLLEPTEENVRIWVECTRMNQEEVADTVKEARELEETFSSIADIMEQKILPSEGQNEEVVQWRS